MAPGRSGLMNGSDVDQIWAAPPLAVSFGGLHVWCSACHTKSKLPTGRICSAVAAGDVSAWRLGSGTIGLFSDQNTADREIKCNIICTQVYLRCCTLCWWLCSFLETFPLLFYWNLRLNSVPVFWTCRAGAHTRSPALLHSLLTDLLSSFIFLGHVLSH